MLTPIYLDIKAELQKNISLLSNLFKLFKEDQLDFLLEAETDIISNESYLLSPRLYLKIYSPHNIYNLDSIKYDVHKSNLSLRQNKVRLLLSPSNGYGINSCYKIEYWMWRPTINYKKFYKPLYKILTQYWYVPTISEQNLIPRYSFDSHFSKRGYYSYPYIYEQSLLTNKLIKVNRTIDNDNDLVIDNLIDIDSIDVFCFKKEDIMSFTEELENIKYNFNNETSKWTFDQKLVQSTLIRNQNKVKDLELGEGEIDININYIRPLTLNQVLFEEENLISLEV